MILVTLGTQDKQFNRLLVEVERLIKNGKITDDVIAQMGKTDFKTDIDSERMKLIKFISGNEMKNFIQNANLIITHGGVGTIIEGLNYGKKIIAVPRLKKYKEHVNDHQLQIIENFNENGFIIGVHEVEELENALEKVESFEPKRFESNNERFVEMLDEAIDKL